MYAKPGYMSYVSICTKMKIRFLFKFIHLVRTALILTSFKAIQKNKKIQCSELRSRLKCYM